MLPEIRIQFSNLVYNTISRDIYLYKIKGEESEMISKEAVRTRADEYRTAWKAKEAKILPAISETYKLSFKQNIIDVYIAPYVPNLSDPMLLNIRPEPDVFVDTLTHELFHRVLTDNAQQIPYAKILDQKFGQYPRMVKNHIYVHAGLQSIFLDTLKQPERLERDIENCTKFPDYNRAWQIVGETGYRELIAEFREFYNL